MRNAISFAIVCGVVGFSGQVAVAGDLRSKNDPSATAIVANYWDGSYIGGNVGAASAKNIQNFTYDGAIYYDAPVISASGAVGGLQVGYDRQFGSYIFGVQIMIDMSNAKGSEEYSSEYPNDMFYFQVDSLGTVTGRLGYLLQDDFMIYAKGGFALANYSFEEVCGVNTAECGGYAYRGGASDTVYGWTYGVGTEYRFNKNWSAFLEYNYLNFGSKRTTAYYDDETTGINNNNFDISQMLFGVNYRF